MTRILVFGSSHVAALRLGWDAVHPEFPEVQLEFMAVPLPDIGSFGRGKGDTFGLIDETKLHPRRLAMIDEFSVARTVQLGGYDHILLIGVNLHTQTALNLCRSHGIEGLRPPPDPQAPLLSRALFRALCSDIVADALTSSMVSCFAGFPVTVLAIPRRSERLVELDTDGSDQARAAAAHPAGMVAGMEIFEAAAGDVLGKRGVRFFRQPPETIGSYGYTREVFSRDNVSMAKNRDHVRDIDTAHMNADYGRIVMRAVLGSILQAVPA